MLCGSPPECLLFMDILVMSFCLITTLFHTAEETNLIIINYSDSDQSH